jgi:hypothetical protein
MNDNQHLLAAVENFKLEPPQKWDVASITTVYNGIYRTTRHCSVDGIEQASALAINKKVLQEIVALHRDMKAAGKPWIKFTLTLHPSGTYETDFEYGEPDMTPKDFPGHATEAILRRGYEARDNVWNQVGKLDTQVLAHIINPAFQGMPEWPDLRQSYKIVHLENGHTIIATNGLSDPFMSDHKFYKPDVNGFGLELYIEITEPFDMAKAGFTWWYNLLYQEALQVAHSGDLLERLNEYGGTISTELYDIPNLPDERKSEGRAPILIGAPSKIVPDEIQGPLSPISFVSIALLTMDELQLVISDKEVGRNHIAQRMLQEYGTPISALDRPSFADKKDSSPLEQQEFTDDYIRPDQVLQEKLFFNLHLYADSPDRRRVYLAFSNDNGQQYLASRALPGQILADAIADELHESLGVTEWKFVGAIEHSDTTTDKKGQAVERVNLYLGIHYFETNPGKKVAGLSMEWLNVDADV